MTIIFAFLLVVAGSGPCPAYYTIERSCHNSEKINHTGKANGTIAANSYYVYSNSDQSYCMGPNHTILFEIREAFVPMDQIKIEGYPELKEHGHEGEMPTADNMLYADIELKNTYDEYHRLQEMPRELLKGLSVPSYRPKEQTPDYAQFASNGNRHSPHKDDVNGQSVDYNDKQLLPVAISGNSGTVKNGELVAIESVNNEIKIPSIAESSPPFDNDANHVKNAGQSNVSKYGAKENGAKAGINLDEKALKERDGMRSIVWGIATVQEFIISNPQLIIVLLLVVAMLVSILRANARRG